MNYVHWNVMGNWDLYKNTPGILGFAGGLLGVALGAVLVVLIIWTLIWKGLALWKAARQGQKGWFVALLLINTVGILDILYIYVFSKKSKSV